MMAFVGLDFGEAFFIRVGRGHIGFVGVWQRSFWVESFCQENLWFCLVVPLTRCQGFVC